MTVKNNLTSGSLLKKFFLYNSATKFIVMLQFQC